MNHNTKNAKIAAISEKTLIVGIDVGSETHYARIFDWRHYEYSKKPFAFSNDENGFVSFKEWVDDFKVKNGKEEVFAAMEPTGHYWFNLGKFLQDSGMKLVHVNPHHVKKTKELDDNNPNKNDRKDPRVIAGLVTEGRYNRPYIPEGIYAEIRSLSNLRLQTQEEVTRIKNRIARWFSIYFPEYRDVYGKPDAVTGIAVLKQAPLPVDIKELGVDGILRIWREKKLRGAGEKRARTLLTAAERSIGSQEAPDAARIEIQNLLEDYEVFSRRLENLMSRLEKKLQEIPNIGKLLEIKGVGLKTVSVVVAEIGDIGRFDNAKQLQKMAGLAIVSNDSGKHNGESRISYRGRKRLRYALYEMALSVVGKNGDFRELHRYYTERTKNPLKKMQSLIAVSCKLIRVLYAILTKGVTYDGTKMLGDIHRPEEYTQAA